ncbi:uncharacterized protein LOC127261381 isoform X2 [Andrographis paniculata]|uniref:uncharacterized protein LOC127261381 isoform X2 n=1 Tax=Andrographis paniculata TaxID=175694 RepID=UPI0021E8855D|nr:uncharacterized protein LOC127261381 isoform X2 [Andrographis paniculata]
MAVGRWRECRGDLMAEGAKSLQRRLRDRFRVTAVNYHRRRNIRISGGRYFSSTVQRWLDRLSDFRRDSLPSSSTFYHKRVSKDIDAEYDSVLTRMLQAVAVPVIGNVCHVFMHGLNRIQIFGADKLQNAVLHRPENKSLITGMDLAISKLNRGGWVHIFPEGSRSRDGGKTIRPAKRGIGRLVLDADNVPLVVPFVHTGMQEVMPVGAKFPKIGKTVTILVGEPISFDDIIEGDRESIPRGELYDAVSARISIHLRNLKLQVEALAIEQALHLQNNPSHSPERAAELLQNIDWESHGITNHMSVENPAPREHAHTLSVEPTPTPTRLYAQETNLQFQEGGFVSRIRGYMDSTELMVFSARGLLSHRRTTTNTYLPILESVSPLKAWNNFWKSMSGNHHFLPNSVAFNEAMQC